jgi:hypothetical protein
VEEHHLRNATHWAKDAKIQFARPSLWLVWSEFLCRWKLRYASSEARGYEQARVRIQGLELSGVDIVKGFQQYNVFDDTDGIDLSDITRPDQRRW